MKKSLKIIIPILLVFTIVCVFIVGKFLNDQEVELKNLLTHQNVSNQQLKESLNSKDNSSKNLDQYKFYAHKEKVKIEFMNKALNDLVMANVSFEYAKSDGKLVVVFPPQIDFITNAKTNVKRLSGVNYALLENKLTVVIHVIAESDTGTTIERAAEYIDVQIKIK